MAIITPYGIVIAADSTLVGFEPGSSSMRSSGTTNKIFVMHGRMAVGTLGMGTRTRLTTLDDRPFFSYDPDVLLREVERKTPEDVSIRRFIDVIESESGSTLSRFNYLIQTGAIKQQQSLDEGAQFFVCGFEAGIAVIEEINFELDWENLQLIGPIAVPVFPHFPARVDFGFRVASKSEKRAIVEVLTEQVNTKAFMSVRSEAAAELAILLSRHDLSLDQASTLLHAMLRAQHNETPQIVGPPYSVVWLRKDGTNNRIDYGD
jgi:hypothetical protein